MKNALSFFAVALLATTVNAQEPAAEVALVTGSVNAVANDSTRAIGRGDFIYAGETVQVGNNSYANLSFKDGSRVLLRPNSEFVVEAFRYDASMAQPEASSPPAATQDKKTKPAEAVALQGSSGNKAFFKLLKGGFRAISGAIGKVDRQNYRVTTPVATIGIRGTDYDAVLCAEDCPNVTTTRAQRGPVMVASTELAGLELAQAGGGSGGGLIVGVNDSGQPDSAVEVTNSKGDKFQVNVNQFLLAFADGQTFVLPIPPDNLLLNPVPSPEDCN